MNLDNNKYTKKNMTPSNSDIKKAITELETVTDINALRVRRNAAISTINFNSQRLDTLSEIAINGKSKIERGKLLLTYENDLNAKIKTGTKKAALGLFCYKVIRKGNFVEILSSLIMACYLNGKINESKNYISADKAFDIINKKLIDAEKEYSSSKEKVEKIENIKNILNNIYNSDKSFSKSQNSQEKVKTIGVKGKPSH